MSEAITLSGNLLGINDALQAACEVSREKVGKKLEMASEMLVKQSKEITELQAQLEQESVKVKELSAKILESVYELAQGVKFCVVCMEDHGEHDNDCPLREIAELATIE